MRGPKTQTRHVQVHVLTRAEVPGPRDVDVDARDRPRQGFNGGSCAALATVSPDKSPKSANAIKTPEDDSAQEDALL